MPENWLNQHSIPYRMQSGQITICCPFCEENKFHCYIDPQKKVFFCHKCNAKGNWFQLTKRINPAASIVPFNRETKPVRCPDMDYIQGRHKHLMGRSGTQAIEYLYSRKFSLDAIQHFLLGLESKDNKEWLVIPYLKNGKPVNIKYRALPPAEKEFRRWKDGETILFNQDCLKDLGEEVFMVEGELDCIALYSQGYRNVVATTIGAGSFKPEWISLLDKFSRINIVYDSDDAGQRGSKEAARRFGFEKCFNVLLPVKDCNDYFISGAGKEDFEELIAKSEQFDVDNIIDFSKAVSNLKMQYNKSGDEDALKPHWPCVAKLTGSFEGGDLITVSAVPKTGKTTWALNITHAFVKQDIPSLFYCLEMRPERLARKIIQIEMGVSEEELTPVIIDQGYIRLSSNPLYFGYNYRKCNLDIVIDTIRQGIRRYGFKFIVFDNLHYLSRSMTNQVQEVSLISKSFKLLAEEMQIPIMLIAQPRKIAEGQVMGMMDLKDSASIGADSDQVIILYRKKMKSENGTAEASYEPLTLVRVDASRYRAGGETLLYFDGATSIFREMEQKR